MGDKLLLIPYIDNFGFQCALFSENAPKFWRLIPNQAKLLEPIFMAVSIDLWPCLFTTKLSYAQLFKCSDALLHGQFYSEIFELQNLNKW